MPGSIFRQFNIIDRLANPQVDGSLCVTNCCIRGKNASQCPSSHDSLNRRRPSIELSGISTSGNLRLQTVDFPTDSQTRLKCVSLRIIKIITFLQLLPQMKQQSIEISSDSSQNAAEIDEVVDSVKELLHSEGTPKYKSKHTCELDKAGKEGIQRDRVREVEGLRMINEENEWDHETIFGFKKYLETPKRAENFLQLKKFIQDAGKNVLFIFGPSGCGKNLLVKSSLTQNAIKWQEIKEKIDNGQNEEILFIDLIESITECLTANLNEQMVYIFNDFPTSYGSTDSLRLRKFKLNLKTMVGSCTNNNKHIFILNSQIYSAFYLLKQSDEGGRLDLLKNVSLITLQPYGLREMGQLLKWLAKSLPQYAATVDAHHSDILIEAAGDARKAFGLVYLKAISEISHRRNPTHRTILKMQLPSEKKSNPLKKQSKFEFVSQKQEEKIGKPSRCGLFHTLGKFLYGKRANILEPIGKNRKQQSRIYTEEELNRLNPPFYFDPVELFHNIHMELSKFIDLIHQNYLSRYGSVRDIRKMSQLFGTYDTLNLYQSEREDIERTWTQLITWGIIVYNRNSIKDNKLFKIGRSNQNIIRKLTKQKQCLVRSHFTGSNGYKMRDLVHFAHLLSRCWQISFHWKSLKDIVLCGRRSRGTASLENGTEVIHDQEEEDRMEASCDSLKEIERQLQAEITRRQELRAILMSDSDQSDIDQ